MKLFDSISHFLFDYRGDAKASMDSKLVWLTYQRAIRYVAFLGILVGLSAIFYYIDRQVDAYLHGIVFLFLSMPALILFLLRMMSVGARSRVSIVMWLCTAISLTATMFKIMSFPGGELLQMFGLPNVLAILCGIGYLTHLPQEYKWVRLPLAWWIIGTQVALVGVWFVFWYHGVYYTDHFEPAISYADWSVIAEQQWEWKAVMRSLGLGVIVLPLSIWLYIVARKHSK